MRGVRSLSGSAVLVVPDCTASSQDPRVAELKARCDESKPLGSVRVDKGESMVIYDGSRQTPLPCHLITNFCSRSTHPDFGCYIDRHGLPVSEARIVRWECKASRFVDRTDHVLLFSSEFVEIRHKPTGRLVQVIEGADIRLHNAGFAPTSSSNANLSTRPGLGRGDSESSVESQQQDSLDSVPILISRRGKRNDVHGQSFELLELVKTAPIVVSSPTGPTPVSPVMPLDQVWRL